MIHFFYVSARYSSACFKQAVPIHSDFYAVFLLKWALGMGFR